MKPTLTLVVGLILLTVGCSTTPSWSSATPAQRQSGLFMEDDAYLVSPQFASDISNSVDCIIRLRQQRAP